MKIITVIGARPNFIKIAPLVKAIDAYNESLARKGKDGYGINGDTLPESIKHLIVHTGQHYDERMSNAFFNALDIPEADFNLEVGSGTHAQQIGKTMMRFEKILEAEQPDWVVVIGDVNASVACSITAKKMEIKVCHIEAGLRSGDISMAEETNRIITDRISDLLLTSSPCSCENLIKEGVDKNKIRYVGNIMIDTLEANREKAEKLTINEIIEKNRITESTFEQIDLSKYALITLHRPSNVDDKIVLSGIVKFIVEEAAAKIPIIWPIHPRTQKMLKQFGLWNAIMNCKNLISLLPLGYHEIIRSNMGATLVLTDSGGIQEESTILGTPCITLRENTERPITLTRYGGTSVLTGTDIDKIRLEFKLALNKKKAVQRPDFWDGKTAIRCVDELVKMNSKKKTKSSQVKISSTI